MGAEIVGRRIAGQYTVTRFIRNGVFASLYDASTLGGTLVAVKLLDPSHYGEPEAKARFNREVRAMASFNHPGSPRVIDHGTTDDGYPWVATERFQGKLLADAMKFGCFPADRVQYLAAEIALVLAAAHAHGIIHRDLAPTNILLAQVGAQSAVVKVLDFGLAQMADSEDDDELTAAGVQIGTIEYMAPEYIQTNMLDHRADLYSLGILMYEMLTGSPPFTGEKLAVYEGHLYTVPEAPSLKAPGTPAWLDALVLKLLAKRPEDRPLDARTVANALIRGG